MPKVKAKVREKVRENLLRRVLERRGYTLRKSRRRDPGALDYGGYWVTDAVKVVAGGSRGMSLDEAERWANSPRGKRHSGLIVDPIPPRCLSCGKFLRDLPGLVCLRYRKGVPLRVILGGKCRFFEEVKHESKG